VNIGLINPPIGNVMQPFIALACLQAHLRQHGYGQVKIWDVSQTIVARFVTSDHLRATLARLERLIDELEPRASRGRGDAARYEEAVAARAAARIALPNIDEAAALLRDPVRFYDSAAHSEAMAHVDRVFAAQSGLHYPQHIDRLTYSCDPASPLDDEPALRRFVQDPNRCLFHAEYQDRIVREIVESKPELLGFSVTFDGQFLPAILLAGILRPLLPSTHFVFGGGFVSARIQSIQTAPWLFEVIDSVVVNEGESALLSLVQRLEAGAPLDSVPNRLFLRDAEVARSAVTVREDMSKLIAPDYSGYDIGQYLVPQWDVLYDPTRGCYWNKCNFCAISMATKGQDRMRDPVSIVDDMQSLCEKHDTRIISFSVDAIPVPLMRAVAEEILRRKFDVSWSSEFILDKRLDLETIELFAASGCNLLLFGLESASPRILRLMKKGTTPERSARIIRDCSEAGITVLLHVLVGYPTETAAELEETIGFIESLRQFVDLHEVNGFYLNEGASIMNEFARVGIAWAGALEQPFGASSRKPFVLATGQSTDDTPDKVRRTRRRLDRALGLEGNPYLADDNAHMHLYLRKTGLRPREMVSPARPNMGFAAPWKLVSYGKC
jgi:hypothetical protein